MDAKPKGLRVSFEETKGGNVSFNMGIDLGEKASKQQSRDRRKGNLLWT